MHSKELEKILREEINDDVRIKEHPSLAGISNVFWRTHEVCPCPTFDVRDTFDTGYYFEFPNGYIGYHNSVEMVKEKTKAIVEFFSSEEGKELLTDEAKQKAIEVVNNVPKPLDEGSITV